MRDRTKVIRMSRAEAREIAATARLLRIGGSALMRRAPELHDALDALTIYAERGELPDASSIADARRALRRGGEDE